VKKKDKNKKKFTPLLWWSLLIHTILLLFILIFAFKKIKQFSPLTIAKLKEKNELPASLKPKKSEFGATVFFDDKAMFKPPETKFMAQQEVQEESEKVKQIQPDPEQKKIEETPKIEKKETIAPPKKEIKKIQAVEKKSADASSFAKATEYKKAITDKEEPKSIKKKKATPKPIKKQETPKDKPKIVEKEKPEQDLEKIKEPQEKQKEEIAKRINEIEQQQEKLAQAATQQPKIQLPKIQKAKTAGQEQEDKSPIKPPKKSIIAMTRGFVENLKDEGDDWLERKGDDNKRPSFEELKYLSYEEKVNWHLQNSWKQNFAYRPWQKILEGKAVVDFKIDENGNVLDIAMLQSSGNEELDNIIIKSVQFAAPFPPLPKHFGVKVYNTGRIIYVNAHKARF
jgi:TolA protein